MLQDTGGRSDNPHFNVVDVEDATARGGSRREAELDDAEARRRDR